MRRNLVRTTAFVRATRRLSKTNAQAANDVEATLSVLSNDAYDAKLKSHKLKGDLGGIWACTAGYDLRILFEFVEIEGAEAILLLNVGTHDEVY